MTNEQTTAVDRTGKIPFGKPTTVGRELEYIAEAIRNGTISGGGPFMRRCEAWLERELPARRALLTHSCTAALEMAAMLSGVGPGDEVIVPSFTFSAAATAFVLRGATPVFVDIRADTLNIDESLIEPRSRRVLAPWCRYITPGWPARWIRSSPLPTATGCW